MMLDYRDRLFALAERMGQAAVDIVQTVPVEGRIARTKTLSLAVLCRTIPNFRGVLLLLRQDLVVEARVLARCCFENLFVAGGLLAEGDEFVAKMKADDIAGRKARLRFVAENPEIFAALSEDTRSEMAKAGQLFETAKGKLLQQKQVSQVGPTKDVYLAYLQYSGDAAHPTMTALFRHMTKEGEGFVFNPKPSGEHQFDETLHLACLAFLSLIVVVSKVHGLTTAGTQLIALNTELLALQAGRWGENKFSGDLEIQTGK